jgi:hypothetical protein
MTDKLVEKREEWRKPGDYGYGGIYSWSELVSSKGAKVIGNWTVGDYQGDELFVLKQGRHFAWVVVGYGSCEGCDWLMSLETFAEIQEARDTVLNGIEWRTKKALIEYLHNIDPANAFYMNEDGAREAITEAISALEKS